MKILCLADEENKAYWDYFRKEKLDDIDLILSCGDLKADYLTFLVTMGHAPLLYIHGNHDEGYRTRPPEGCDCIDDKVVTFRGQARHWWRPSYCSYFRSVRSSLRWRQCRSG